MECLRLPRLWPLVCCSASRAQPRIRPPLRQHGLVGLRQHAQSEPLLPARPDHYLERRPARPRVHRRPEQGRPGNQERPADLPGRHRREDVHHLRRRPGLRGERRHGRRALALRALQPRQLQELRHRRQPRRRLLRRADLPAHTRHDDRRPRPGERQAARPRADRASGSGSTVELRLLGDERSDLRRPPSDRRRGRLGVRRPRLRDGVQHPRPHARVGEPVLDDPAERHLVAEGGPLRGRLHRLDADDGRPDLEHPLLRDGGRCPALLPVAPARDQPALRFAHRRRPRTPAR